jgi:predicted  nucleic acid-binding Zn-ribbon protein
MDISNNIDELKEQVYTTSKTLQEIADLKHEVQGLNEKKTQLNKQIQTAKLSIDQKEGVLFAPYMEKADPQQTIQFE